MDIRLLVLRTGNMQRLASFYGLLGCTFDHHQHGNSPLHYSATIGQTILEIYPLAKGQAEADKHLRLGFGIDNFDERIAYLKSVNIPFVSEPVQTEFGLMAVITDPDERKIELYRK